MDGLIKLFRVPCTILDWACVTFPGASKKSTREFIVWLRYAIILWVSLGTGPFDYKVSDTRCSRCLVVSHTPLPADREIKQMTFLVSNAPEALLFFIFHSFYLKHLWVNSGTVGTSTWTCSGYNERKRTRSDVSVKGTKIQCVLRGKILNTHKIKNKSGFLIKISI